MLCSADFVRGISNISNNLQDKFLASALRETQDVDFQQVVGTKMLNRLCNLVQTGDITKEENKKYKQLLDEGQWFMAYSTIAKICVISSVKIDNIGLNTTNDVNANQISINDVFKIQDFYIKKADYYKGRFQDYCAEHRHEFEEMKNLSCYDVKPELNSAASCNIFLGGARGKRGFYGCRRCNRK